MHWYRLRLGHVGDGSSAGGGASTGSTGSSTSGSTAFDYYVAKSAGASDTNNGLSKAWTSGQNGPFLTIGKGMQVATAALAGSGKSIGVLTGTYDEAITDGALGLLGGGGSWSNAVTVQRYGVERPLLQETAGTGYNIWLGKGSYLIFDGIDMDASFQPYGNCKLEADASTRECHHFRVQNCTVTSASTFTVTTQHHWEHFSAQAGFQGHIGVAEFINLKVTGGPDNITSTSAAPNESFYLNFHNCLVDNCDISSVTGNVLQVFSNIGLSLDGCVVRNNRCHDVRKVIPNDPFHRNIMLTVYGTHTNTQIYNNTIWNIGSSNADTVIGIEAGAGSVDTLIAHNSVTLCSGNGNGTGIKIDADNGSSCIVRNNAAWGNLLDFNNSGLATNDHNDFGGAGNPGWTDSTNGNFTVLSTSRLLAAGSTTLSTIVTTDSTGVARSTAAPTIGSYE